MADGLNALPAVYAAIAAVMEDVGQEGIAKGRRNQQQGYSFRGIDDVYNALAPLLARHHLIIVPRVLTREKTEQTTQKGGILFYVVVQVEFDIVCASDGSKITACTWGEAMDSADKATNKAMSAAYKYMAMQTFCIPTEGDNDADASHHEVKANAGASASPRKAQQATGAEAIPPASAPVQTMGKADARGDFGVLGGLYAPEEQIEFEPAQVSPPSQRGQLTAQENAGRREQSPEPSSSIIEHDGEEVDQTTQPEWPILESEMEAYATRDDLKAWWTTPEKKALKARKPHLMRAFYRFAYTPRFEELGEMIEWTDEAGVRG